MTERRRDGSRRQSAVTRRRLLATTATGLTGTLAGCGYRPGGGDLAWESTLSTGGPFGPGRRWFVATDDRLVTVRNQSGRTYDFEAEEWRNVENAAVTAIDGSGTTRLDAATERQAVGPPAVTGDSVFVPVEGDRVTAIDREAAGVDLDDPETIDGPDGSGSESGADERDEIRWQVDDVPADSDRSEPSVAVSASDRLVVVTAGTGIVALDAETGDRAFEVSNVQPSSGGDAERVAVDGADVWVTVDHGGIDDRSGDPSVVVRFDSVGNRRVERGGTDSVDWLVAVDGLLLVGDAGRGSVIGFDRDLNRRFTLEGPTPTRRPPIVEGTSDDGGRVYLGRGETIRAIDIDGENGDGKLAWERSDVPTRQRLAVDENGLYAVDFRGGDPSIVAVGVDGKDRWTAPLPDGVRVDELFAIHDRLLVVDDGTLYGLYADPGERWSLL